MISDTPPNLYNTNCFRCCHFVFLARRLFVGWVEYGLNAGLNLMRKVSDIIPAERWVNNVHVSSM